MKIVVRLAFCVLALVVAVGCASTEVVKRDSKIGVEKLAKPGRIYVYPFAATPEDVPSWSASAGQHASSTKPPTSEELEVGREVGALVAKNLVTEIAKTIWTATRRTPCTWTRRCRRWARDSPTSRRSWSVQARRAWATRPLACVAKGQRSAHEDCRPAPLHTERLGRADTR